MTTKTKDVWITERYFARREGWQDASHLYSITNRLFRNRTGVSVAHWKDKIRQKQDASSALTGRFDSSEGTGGEIHCTYRVRSDTGAVSETGDKFVRENVNGYTAGYINGTPTPNFLWNSAADGRARNKFLSNVRRLQTKMQGAVFLKEIDQTWHMLHRPASALWDNINRYYAALRNAKKRFGKVGWIAALPSLWLEYSFGWRPLMMDIDDAFDALNSVTERDNVFRVVGSGSDSSLRSTQTGTNSPGSTYAARCVARYYSRVTEFDTVRYVGGVRFLQNTTFADKAAQWGFTPSEFLPSAWEILPWSFLVDYFVTIGDYLDATFAKTSNIIWCVKTQRQICESYYTSKPDHSGIKQACGAGYISSGGSASTSKYRRRTVKRVVVNGNSITPALYIKWNGPTSGQFANISALFGQASANLHSQQYSGRTFRISR